MNSFLSLFYIAFYLQDWDRLQDVRKYGFSLNYIFQLYHELLIYKFFIPISLATSSLTHNSTSDREHQGSPHSIPHRESEAIQN